jgi:hypothetical protein
MAGRLRSARVPGPAYSFPVLQSGYAETVCELLPFLCFLTPLGQGSLHITGFPGSSAWANGYYEFFRDISVSSVGNCAYCPIYVGPETAEKRVFLFSLRPFSEVGFSTALWLWIVLSARDTLNGNFRSIAGALVSIGLNFNDVVKVIQNPLIEESIGVILLDQYELTKAWDLTDVNPAAASVFFLSDFPQVINGLVHTTIVPFSSHPFQSVLFFRHSVHSQSIPRRCSSHGLSLPRVVPTFTT